MCDLGIFIMLNDKMLAVVTDSGVTVTQIRPQK